VTSNSQKFEDVKFVVGPKRAWRLKQAPFQIKDEQLGVMELAKKKKLSMPIDSSNLIVWLKQHTFR